MSGCGNVLKVNGECITGKDDIRELITEFWEDTGAVGEILECVKRQKNI